MQLQKTSVFLFKAPLPCTNYFFPNKPHAETFQTLQSKWVPEEEFCLNNNSAFRGQNSTKFWIFLIIVIQMFSLFIHVTNLKIAITNLNLKFCIFYLKSWYFLNNSVSNFLEERSSTICEWRIEINMFNLVYCITQRFIKHNLRFRIRGP